ncbi:MAG TPA: glycosyltransferase family 2 protein [Pyrinomonadaceae bacterium]
MNISAVIIAFNEADNIGDAIRSVEWADEILVVDSESTDDTRDIAASLGAKVIVQPWLGFSRQKQFATDQAANDYILSIDADERVTPELRDEILEIARNTGTKDGYTIPRLSIYMGRQIRHSGWYPDRQLRLFDRRRGRWNDRVVHESLVMEQGAEVGRLEKDLHHFTVRDAQHHAQMIAERYAPLSALQAHKEGKRGSVAKAVVSGWAAFLRSYVFKLGFLDGEAGYCIAMFAAHYARLKNLILADLNNKASNSAADITT